MVLGDNQKVEITLLVFIKQIERSPFRDIFWINPPISLPAGDEVPVASRLVIKMRIPAKVKKKVTSRTGKIKIEGTRVSFTTVNKGFFDILKSNHIGT